MKRGGPVEDLWVKVKNRFKKGNADATYAYKSPEGAIHKVLLDYKNADANQIARYIQLTNTYEGRGMYEVRTIFINQGDRYGVYKKLYNTAVMLKVANRSEGDEILNALKNKIRTIPEEKRSKQLRTLLTEIEDTLNLP